jgi:predicted metal-dependent peptidase
MILVNQSQSEKEQRGPFAKPKVQLIVNHPFFGVLACHLPCVPVSAAFLASVGAPPTAAVDGRKIYYYAPWVEGLTDKQRLGLLCHEVLHPALGHLWRRGNRRVDLWLRATDYAVNDVIMRTTLPNGQCAFELPPGGLYDKRFAGMAVEQIYAILLKEEQERKEKGQPEKKNENPVDGQLEKPIEPDDKKKEKKKKKPGKGKPDNEKPDPKAEKEEGKGGKDKPENKPEDKPENKDGKGKDDPEDDLLKAEEEDADPSDGKGEPGEDGDEPGEDGEDAEGDEGDDTEDQEGDPAGPSSKKGKPGEGEAPSGNEPGDGEEETEDPALPGDEPGEDGEDGEPSQNQPEGEDGHVDCAHGDLEEVDESLNEFWRGALNQALMVAKSRGNVPGALSRLVEEVTAPKVPWQQVIEQFVNEVVRDDYDMMKQDRRFLEAGIYFPELQSNATNIAVVVDSSGSIGQKELKSFVGEIVGILRCRGIASVRIMSCDDKVMLDETISPTDALPENYPGGGGTDFRPPFKRLRDEPGPARPALVVYLTDMMGTFPDKDPLGLPTIWLASCPPWMKEEQLPVPCFGVVIPYDPLTDEE